MHSAYIELTAFAYQAKLLAHCWYNAGPTLYTLAIMLGQRCTRWFSIMPTLGQHRVFSGIKIPRSLGINPLSATDGSYVSDGLRLPVLT